MVEADPTQKVSVEEKQKRARKERQKQEREELHRILCIWPVRILTAMAVMGIALFSLIWLTTAFIPVFPDTTLEIAAGLGDSFGTINAFVSALAFAAVVYSIHQQQRQLEMQRDELELQRVELSETREVIREQKAQQEILNRVTALSTIQQAIEGWQTYNDRNAQFYSDGLSDEFKVAAAQLVDHSIRLKNAMFLEHSIADLAQRYHVVMPIDITRDEMQTKDLLIGFTAALAEWVDAQMLRTQERSEGNKTLIRLKAQNNLNAFCEAMKVFACFFSDEANVRLATLRTFRDETLVIRANENLDQGQLWQQIKTEVELFWVALHRAFSLRNMYLVTPSAAPAPQSQSDSPA